MANWKQRSAPYKPGQTAPYKISRSKIELYMQCARCFWLDLRLGIKRPNGPPFTINKAIDALLKKEFNSYRIKGKPHPIMIEFGVDAIPFQHEQLDTWRQTFVGDWQISYKRQLEIYQWLLRQVGLKVSDTGYFVYANGRLDLDGFFDRIEFRTKIIPYHGDDSWIEPTLLRIKDCLENDMPAVGLAAMGGTCDFCAYARSRTELTLQSVQSKQKSGSA